MMRAPRGVPYGWGTRRSDDTLGISIVIGIPTCGWGWVGEGAQFYALGVHEAAYDVILSNREHRRTD